MNITKKQAIQHLYWRAGFGATPAEINKLENQTPKQWVSGLLADSKADRPINVVSDLLRFEKKEMLRDTLTTKKDIQTFKMNERTDFISEWALQLMGNNGILRERMTFFWHCHFALRTTELWAENYINIIRKHALGSFFDLLIAISQSTAMLRYLNLNKSRKENPNENFARELLELFTLGTDNYTQKDIKEASRAFTGWRHTSEGNFRIQKSWLDTGEKEFLGQKGAFNGYDVIKIILQQKKCADFIAAKIYAHFVSDIPNINRITDISDFLYAYNYNIEKTMEYIFSSDWFFDKENINSIIKSPIDLLIGLSRTFELKFDDSLLLVVIMRNLQQVLTEPPNVAGWPKGKAWINGNSLLKRLSLPRFLLLGAPFDVETETQLTDEDKRLNKLRMSTVLDLTKRTKGIASWEPFFAETKNWKVEDLNNYFSILPMPQKLPINYFSQTNDKRIADLILASCSIEYQLR